MKSLPLGDISLETFLSEYWQKKPLLIRNGIENISSPLTAEELAGLACEKDIESRLIINHQENDSWDLQHGPFNDEVFSNLPQSHWTLLVQAVDHWIPQAAQLLEQFNFIPRWRIDDLMMSYANDGGGVGPHFDHYDVFLVQACGSRQWQIGGLYNENSPLKENLPVKILEEFNATESWLLEPGDILYVPPGVGHNGIAKGDGCITCSVGFRAPAHSDILREFTDYINDQLTEAHRYQDADLTSQTNTGEISEQSILKVQTILKSYIEDKHAIREWFGRYVTHPKYPDTDSIENTINLEDLKKYFSSGKLLYRNESSRFAYHNLNGTYQFYVDGESFSDSNASKDLIELLCAKTEFSHNDFIKSENNDQLLLMLLNKGSLYVTNT